MVRMLGFSDEDKQRIGVAQQVAGKGVVRGVLGLPGRLVGGILGGASSETLSNMTSENQVTLFCFFFFCIDFIYCCILHSSLTIAYGKYTSLLQIFGLISFLKKRKKERRENLLQILGEIKTELHPRPQKDLIKLKMVQIVLQTSIVCRFHIPTKTETDHHPEEVLLRLKPRIPSSQRYPSLLKTVPNFQDSNQDTHKL